MNGIIDPIRAETESSVALQQGLFKKWIGMWPGVLIPPPAFEEPQKFHKKWMEVGGELLRKQNEWLKTQFEAGLRTIEDTFHLAEAKDAEELRTRTIQLWQRTFDCLCQASEAQIRGLHSAMGKWTELMNKGPRPVGPPVRAPESNRMGPKGGSRSKVSDVAKNDQEELKEAMMEYEMTKGDLSKGR
jgi:hypothetical protein